jgi:hypothetical protein
MRAGTGLLIPPNRHICGRKPFQGLHGFLVFGNRAPEGTKPDLAELLPGRGNRRRIQGRNAYVGPRQGFKRAEDVILQLADDGHAVDCLNVFVHYMSRSGT